MNAVLINDSVPASIQTGPTRSEGRRILMVQFSPHHDGSAVSGLLGARGLIERGWAVHVAFASEGPFIEQYKRAGCSVHVVPHKNWLRSGRVVGFTRNLWAELRAARRMQELIQSVQPDLVYVNTLASLVGAVAARRASLPCIWHIRELFTDADGEMSIPPLGKSLVRRIVRRLSTRVIVISQAVRENVLGEAVPAAIVPNAVSDDYLGFNLSGEECRHRLNLPLDVPIVGVPGTLRPVKGHPFFLRAAAVVNHPQCQFAITGDGEAAYREQLESHVREDRLSDRVRFLGTVPDMRLFYRACDVICVPSRSESFGRTVIEAFAIGTPLVATAVGGIRETVDEETGTLVAYGDVKGLADALTESLGVSPLRERKVLAARRKVEERYCEAAYGAGVASILEQAIASRQSCGKSLQTKHSRPRRLTTQ